MAVVQMDDDAADGNDNSAVQPHQSEESDGDDFGRDLDDIDVSSTMSLQIRRRSNLNLLSSLSQSYLSN